MLVVECSPLFCWFRINRGFLLIFVHDTECSMKIESKLHTLDIFEEPHHLSKSSSLLCNLWWKVKQDVHVLLVATSRKTAASSDLKGG